MQSDKPVAQSPDGELLTLRDVYQQMFGNSIGTWLYAAVLDNKSGTATSDGDNNDNASPSVNAD